MPRLRDVPELPPDAFTFENMLRRQYAPPCYLDIASGNPVVEAPWELVGWSGSVAGRLMHGREGQLCLMLFHPEHGQFWQHYPLFDAADRAAAVFVPRRLPS